MKRATLVTLLALAACGENVPHIQPPMDHFFSPAGVAITPVDGGRHALLGVSSNYGLRYDKAWGGTLLSVDPSLYDPATGTGGSAGRPGGALDRLGPGGQLGSYAGPPVVVDQASCASLFSPPAGAGISAPFGTSTQVLVASRYTRQMYRFTVAPDGAVAPCQGADCELGTDPDLLDPEPIALACRADGKRRSAFVGYLRTPQIGNTAAYAAWISEYDLGDLGRPPRRLVLGTGPIGDMAYDATTDRLFAVGRFSGLSAPLFILDLQPCVHWDAACPGTLVHSVDLYGSLRGAELVGIALSNPQPGRPRLAYVVASVYDEAYALATARRPPYDLGAALLVVELGEGVGGVPTGRVQQVVSLGLSAGAVRVLPVRPGRGDVVVLTSPGDGTVQVYDGEVGAVVRVVSLDLSTGIPEAGRLPAGMAVEDRGTEALIYIASFADWTVSLLRVPLAAPSTADLVRFPASEPDPLLRSKPIRIGRYVP